MSTWATVGDVEALYEGTVLDRAQALLDRGERELARLVPDLGSRAALDSSDDEWLDPDLIRDVVVDAVIRRLQNPKGYAYERAGDYGYGYGVDNVAGSGDWFTDAELARLRLGVAGKVWATVGSIDLVPGMAPPNYPRTLRADPMAWTSEKPAGVREQEVP